MVRDDLIDGAVTFLQDPSVSTAPLEQKLSFLRSKNLTQEEIDASLARVGQSPTAQAPIQSSAYSTAYRQPPPQYGGYQQQQHPYWGQPPPEIPRRDWRDWFIMATVMGGASYALYWSAKRYIYPLIAPPTAPQLEQDKASIDTSFEKAFVLLDQLATDTKELKDAEAARKSRLDHVLAEVESVVTKMKEANDNRELEAKRMAREIEDIKDQIPQAIQKEKETMDSRLKDLATEMKSLKTLMGSRVGGTAPVPRGAISYGPVNGVNGTSSAVLGAETNGVNGSTDDGEKPASVLPERSTTPTYAGRTLAGKAQIPAWQLAAKKKAEEAKVDSGNAAQNTSDSGTMADLVDGSA